MGVVSFAETTITTVDLFRWGQDGLAVLTSSGQIVLLRGAVVVPGLLRTGASPASLGLVSSTTLAKGSGDVLLTLAGANFAPGVAVTWNVPIAPPPSSTQPTSQ